MTGEFLARGKLALSSAAWAEADAAFCAALSAGESPEAYEGLAWAAWWQNDSDKLFHSREMAHRLYLDRGDRAGAARTAMWLAADYVDFRGEVTVANGWRQRARRLLEDLPALVPEQGWLALLEGDAALLLEGNTAVARSCGARAREVGLHLAEPDLEVLGLALEGLSMVSEARVAEGMDLLDEAGAGALAGGLRQPFSPSWAFCYLIYACERARDYQRAGDWCERMRAYATRLQFRFALGVCRAHYGGVLTWRGALAEAEKELSSAVQDLQSSRPPVTAEASVRLGELRRRQGRPDEAYRLFTEADWHPLAMLGLAELALERGQALEALAQIDRYLRQTPAENKLQLLPAIELRVRAQAAIGDLDKAAAALAEVNEIAQTVGTSAARGEAAFCAGIVAAAGGDRAEARRCFEDAAGIFLRAGAPYEAALARQHLSGLTVEPSPSQSHSASPLTGREIDVLRLVAKGQSDREIAATLVLSEHTVHRHVANILSKLGAPSRAAAVAEAAQRHLI